MEPFLEKNRDTILKIAGKYGVKRLRVFGSFARGENDEKSDLDILILPPPGFSLWDHSAMQDEIADAIGVKVDLVSERGLRERMRKEVLSQAVPL